MNLISQQTRVNGYLYVKTASPYVLSWWAKVNKS